eukprot:2521025-Alexandrium_andersonii.AAC.1
MPVSRSLSPAQACGRSQTVRCEGWQQCAFSAAATRQARWAQLVSDSKGRAVPASASQSFI